MELCCEPKLLPETVQNGLSGEKHKHKYTGHCYEWEILPACLHEPSRWLKVKTGEDVPPWRRPISPSPCLLTAQSRFGEQLIGNFSGNVHTPVLQHQAATSLPCLFLLVVVLSSESNSAENCFQPKSRSSVLTQCCLNPMPGAVSASL